MRLTKSDSEAVEWLREWAAEGFPKRVDGSFPTDFLTAMKRLARVSDKIGPRLLEDALVAMPDMDYVLPRRSYATVKRVKAALEA